MVSGHVHKLSKLSLPLNIGLDFSCNVSLTSEKNSSLTCVLCFKQTYGDREAKVID